MVYVPSRNEVWRKGFETFGRGLYNLSGMQYRDLQKESYNEQIAYEEYLRQGNIRAYNDWQKNVGSQGRTIRYPELSYPGQIHRSDTAIARNLLDYSTADSNFISNLPYRTVGLYSIGGRLSRTL